MNCRTICFGNIVDAAYAATRTQVGYTVALQCQRSFICRRFPHFRPSLPCVAPLPYLPLASGAGNIFATFDIFNAARHGVKGTHTQPLTHAHTQGLSAVALVCASL